MYPSSYALDTRNAANDDEHGANAADAAEAAQHSSTAATATAAAAAEQQQSPARRLGSHKKGSGNASKVEKLHSLRRSQGRLDIDVDE